mgnify:CR=1 FL=1
MIEGLKPYAEYEESGLPWLGTVPAHWVTKRGKSYMTAIDRRSQAGKEELLTVSSARGVIPRNTAKVTMSYWSLPEEALDDPDALKVWAELAYQAALRRPEKPKRSRTKKTAAPESEPSPGRRRGRSGPAPRDDRRATSRRGK